MADNIADGAQPSLNVLVQYVKDLSFENPAAPRSLGPRRSSPNISIGINVTANPLDEEDYEIELRLDGYVPHHATVSPAPGKTEAVVEWTFGP